MPAMSDASDPAHGQRSANERDNRGQDQTVVHAGHEPPGIIAGEGLGRKQRANDRDPEDAADQRQASRHRRPLFGAVERRPLRAELGLDF